LLCAAAELHGPRAAAELHGPRAAALAPRVGRPCTAPGVPAPRAAIPAPASASAGRTCSGDGEQPRWSYQGKKKDLSSGPLQNLQKKTLIVRSVYFFYFDFIHVVPRLSDSGVYLSEIVLIGFNSTISAYWNEFAQNRWIFTISRNTGGFAYFPHKCGGFLELTHVLVYVLTCLSRGKRRRPGHLPLQL
jgi:hypothetical protein